MEFSELILSVKDNAQMGKNYLANSVELVRKRMGLNRFLEFE